MNIFYLSNNPLECAEQMPDIHVGSKSHGGKMIVETAQLLSLAYSLERLAGPDCPRTQKGTPRKHFNPKHPCGLWTVKDKCNWLWLLDLGFYMVEEKKYRGGNEHYCLEFFKWCSRYPPELPYGNFTEPPQCMPEEYQQESTIEAYRDFYWYDKRLKMDLTWTERDIPLWYSYRILDGLTEQAQELEMGY